MEAGRAPFWCRRWRALARSRTSTTANSCRPAVSALAALTTRTWPSSASASLCPRPPPRQPPRPHLPPRHPPSVSSSSNSSSSSSSSSSIIWFYMFYFYALSCSFNVKAILFGLMTFSSPVTRHSSDVVIKIVRASSWKKYLFRSRNFSKCFSRQLIQTTDNFHFNVNMFQKAWFLERKFSKKVQIQWLTRSV